jgi:hypothetical protein
MENSTLLDVRILFLNRVLFGSNTAPELLTDSPISGEFNRLLQLDENADSGIFLRGISALFLVNLNVIERLNLIEIIIADDVYNKLMFIEYMITIPDKRKTEDTIHIKIYDDLMGYYESSLITHSVLTYCTIMLDRLILFNFNNPGMISKSEYMKISTQLLTKDMDKFFLVN